MGISVPQTKTSILKFKHHRDSQKLAQKPELEMHQTKEQSQFLQDLWTHWIQLTEAINTENAWYTYHFLGLEKFIMTTEGLLFSLSGNRVNSEDDRCFEQR